MLDRSDINFYSLIGRCVVADAKHEAPREPVVDDPADENGAPKRRKWTTPKLSVESPEPTFTKDRFVIETTFSGPS
jgi:hypothetical protein